ncbi:MAG: Holliday junction DNA helicase RuvA, partial [Deltaproteobacteria bacterium]
MIGYLEGSLLNKYEDCILLLVNHVGYEVLLPSFVMDTLEGKATGERVSV